MKRLGRKSAISSYNIEEDETRTQARGVRQVTSLDFIWDNQKGALIFADSFNRSISLFNLTTNERTTIISQVCHWVSG